jgi:iron-only hydrogenase group A
MSITINGREIEFAEGETVLTVAKRAGIEIPHLCSLEWVPSPAASCRLCMVEVEGMPRLQTSCTLEARDDMKVRTHTPRLLKHRRTIMELLVASHPQDCLTCVRGGDCELATLAADLGVRERRYSGITKGHRMDVSSPAITRDPNKCVLCGRCVTMCHSVQGVGAIDFVGRGFHTNVAPAYHPGLNVSGCIFCGQCVRACPTGALSERSHVDAVVQAIADPDTVVVVQVAPAVPVTLVESVAGATPHALLERLAAALKRVGFDAVFDTSFTADLTIMEEGSELVRRVREGGVLPMFTSCSPGWVQYVEMYRPDLIPNLSTCKSPQQMAGALIKLLYPRQVDLRGKRLIVVSVMPCTAKKFEAQDQGDVDYVLTTRELVALLGRFGMDLNEFDQREPLDAPFGEATGAGRLFAGTGGVMEAAIRTAHKLLTGSELPDGPKVTEARGMDGLKTFSVEAGGVTLNMGIVNGLGRLAAALELIEQGGLDLHFIEVMTCPGGCIGGGGQPYSTDLTAVRERLDRLYELDRRSRRRVSHENFGVQALYERLLGEPLGKAGHDLLHRTYVDRSRPLDDEPETEEGRLARAAGVA